ncbi:hypothetical protein Unana1_08260 [Umbelopsis nana]
MEQACRNWESCMIRDPLIVGRAKVSAETFAEIINGFVDPISYKSMTLSMMRDTAVQDYAAGSKSDRLLSRELSVFHVIDAISIANIFGIPVVIKFVAFCEIAEDTGADQVEQPEEPLQKVEEINSIFEDEFNKLEAFEHVTVLRAHWFWYM